MRERAGDRIAGHAFGAAAATPRVGVIYPALEDGPVGFDALPCCGEAELVEVAERGQVRGR